MTSYVTNNGRSIMLMDNKLKRAKISLIILSLLQLLVVFIYITIKDNLKRLSSSSSNLKDDMFIFNLITYFGLSFSLAGLIVALFENHCFISCFAVTNLGHLIVVMTKTSQLILFTGYFAINIAIIMVSFVYCHLLRMKLVQLHLNPTTMNHGTQNSGSIFNVQENIFRQPMPPSYKEVIKHPDKYPCLFDTIHTPPTSEQLQDEANNAKVPEYSTIYL
ncbi:uncharacterized protein LOC124495513 isoform X3 [Dermatophagoides farinae]|uniref:Uncharacterized protein n=2 Tax=Dermatophagoides farinae TaxID=6954 RepID=A0A922L7Y7_DERFA|nr:uncharacterized protein LOC124495513 isoform X2 [Dermatophagoides farinae]KAH7640521.1 hypothetical protein HUG17_7988 [Dermatophagoides farinae]KAH9525999.1 hypothetical protein DERF_000118 [Dermatophagoides farinae]